MLLRTDAFDIFFLISELAAKRDRDKGGPGWGKGGGCIMGEGLVTVTMKSKA